MSKTAMNEAAASGIDIAALRRELLKELKAELCTVSKKEVSSLSKDEKEREKWLNEYVQIQLFKDGKDYRDDVCVAVNGENCVIARGVPVRVKRKFALALEAGRRQDVAAEEYAESRQNEFSLMEKRFCV